jgi:peptidoglycan/LPS O-acetylase OafA/YrhL
MELFRSTSGVCTIAISSIAYLVIEEPLDQFGRRLAKRFREPIAETGSGSSVQSATTQSALVQEK